jgi:hypothetical protein
MTALGTNEASDAILARALLAAQEHRPHRRAILLLAITAAVLSLVAVTALALGVRNIASQNASVACQRSLLANLTAQTAAGTDSGTAVEAVALTEANGQDAQTADLVVLSDSLSSVDEQKAALSDYAAQSRAMAASWRKFYDARIVGDRERANNPVVFHC